MGIHNAGLNNALADSRSNAQMKNKDGNEIEESGEQHRLTRLENTRGDDGGNRIGGIMKAIHEVKNDGQTHQQGHNP